MRLRRMYKGTATLAALVAVGAATFIGALTANASVPLAARLLAEPWESTGIRVSISNLGSQMRGLTTDGSTVYALNQSGNVFSIPVSSIDPTEAGSTQHINGTEHQVGWGEDGAPSMPPLDTLSIAYSHGCIFITNNNNNEGSIELYCIDTSDYSVTEIEIPATHPLPAGNYFITSSLIDFPDGRIGKVSKYNKQSDHYYTSTLRTYNVSGTGKNVNLSFSEDYVMKDTDTVYNDANGWARDEHGIATDGTYLYRIQWNSIVPNTKVWALEGGGQEAEVAYGGSYTQPFSNMHYLSHNHIDNYYLMGHFWGNEFFMTTAADPGPGPGNPLIPTFGSVTRTVDGYSVQITNYDPNFDWQASVPGSGSVSISPTGLLTVTGLAPSTTATATVETSRTNFPDGEGSIAGTSLDPTPDDGDGIPKEVEDGAPNDGDGNNDGVADSDQANVSSFINSVTGKYTTLAVDEDCSITSVSIEAEDSLLAQDSSYEYPAGLIDFSLDCGVNGYTATIAQYYHDVTNNGFAVRKYDPRTKQYTTIDQSTVSAHDSLNATVATYAVTDGGSLDQDGQVNGRITDPSGLAQSTTNDSSLSDNLVKTGALLIPALASVGLMIAAALVTKKEAQ